MKSISVIIALGCILMAGQIQGGPLDESAQACNAFGFDLYQTLSTESTGNLVICPPGLYLALGMAWAGADGQTFQQMSSVLHVDPDLQKGLAAFAGLQQSLEGSGKDFELHFANRAWVMKGMPLKQGYLDALQTFTPEPPLQLDFGADPEGARKTINDWASDQTAGRIPELIAPGTLSGWTGLVLTDAAYLKARWEYPFPAAAIGKAPFLAPDGPHDVLFMNQTEEFPYLDTDQAQFLALPYTGDTDLEMVIVLPHDPDQLPRLENGLTPEAFSARRQGMTSSSVKVSLPRFTMASKLDLNRPLAGMGMARAFAADADFSGITDGQLFISKVVQKNFIQVDETGSEAASASAVIMERVSSIMGVHEVEIFKADHPFLFFIRHRGTGAILFRGRVADPSA